MNAIPVHREGVCCHALDGEAVLYDPAHHAVHYLNTTAYLIWQHCDGKADVRTVLERLGHCFTYDGPADELEVEIATALGHLVENGLIDWGQLQAA